jgi:Cof subfamily protein (haloacid dehalogenase superfamily)
MVTPLPGKGVTGMDYRLIALDLDGTSVVGGHMPTPRVRAAVTAAQERGVHVVLATGRPYLSALRWAAAFELQTPLICFQGALVKEQMGERATLMCEPLPLEPLPELIALAGERGWELTLYTEDAIYLARMSNPPSFYDLWFGSPLRRMPSLAEALRAILAQGVAPIKGLFIGRPEDNDGLTAELDVHFAGRLAVVRSHDLFVEVTSPKASKGNALAFLAGRYGVARAETIAAGDSGNDVSMVQWAGMGVAVANATPDVLAAADWIAPPVTEDGVATLIEQFVLGDGHF